MPRPPRSPKPDSAGDAVQLGPSEHLELVRSEYEVRLAEAQLRAERLAAELTRSQAEVALRAAGEKVQAATAARDAALAGQRALASDLAQRYAFDWSTHSYCPDTGAVRLVAAEGL